MNEFPPSEETEPTRAALHDALGAYFAVESLGSSSLAYLYASAVPSLFLWVHAWHPLPNLVAWFAALAWGSCGCLAVSFGVGAWRSRARLIAALPQARRAASLELAPGEPVAMVSSLLLLLSVIASSLLFLHGLAPGLVSVNALALDEKAWILLVTAALGNRYVERLA